MKNSTSALLTVVTKQVKTNRLFILHLQLIKDFHGILKKIEFRSNLVVSPVLQFISSVGSSPDYLFE